MMMFLSSLTDILPGVGVFRYITFRTGAALLTSGLIVFLFGPSIIASLKVRQGKGSQYARTGHKRISKKPVPQQWVG